MRHRHGALDVQVLARELGDADRRAAATGAPQILLGEVARVRIADLDHEARFDAVEAQAVVEVLLHQVQHVLDGSRRFVGVGLELECALGRLDHDDGAGAGCGRVPAPSPPWRRLRAWARPASALRALRAALPARGRAPSLRRGSAAIAASACVLSS